MHKPIYAGVTKPTVTPIVDGEYGAVLFQIIQIGHQKFSKGGKEWYSPQIMIGFELPELTYDTKDGPVTQIKSSTYFLSLNPKSNEIGLREIVDGLRNGVAWTDEELEQFDIAQYMGRPCMLAISGVESKGKVYSNITGISAVDQVEGAKLALNAKRPQVFITTDDFSDETVLSTLPNWIQEKIRSSKEYQELVVNENEVEEVIVAPEGEAIKLSDIPF